MTSDDESAPSAADSADHPPDDKSELDMASGPTATSPATPTPEAFLLTIGDIGVSQHWVVTPNGTARLAGTTWIAQDQSRTDSRIPAYAIVLAIIFAIFCLIGLLFLLIKEQYTTGYVSVTVQGDGLFHVTQVPVGSPSDVARVRADVNQAQSLAIRDRST